MPTRRRPACQIPSLRAEAALRKLGQDIAIARRRRRFTQERLAEGASVSVATIQRLEKGDAGISIGTLAMVFLVLGETDRISGMIDIGKDDIGLMLSLHDLPKRVRSRKFKPAPGQSVDGDFDPGVF